MEKLTSGSLEIHVRKEAHQVVMNWLGQSDTQDPSVTLTPYLSEVLLNMDDAELMIVFKELEYMNSSTVPPIVRFIKRLNSKKINTTIIYDKASIWQSASFKVLETFPKALDYITVKGA